MFKNLAESQAFILAKVCIVLVLTQTGWGGYPVILKIYTADIDPLVFSLLRDLFSFPILYALAVLFEGVQPIKSLKDGLVIAVLGLVCMCLGQLLYIYGLKYSTSNASSIFQTFLPVGTSFLSMAFGFEPVGIRKVWGWLKIGGIAVSFAGMMWMVFASLSGGISFNWAAVPFLIQVSLSTAYLLIQKYFFFLNKEDGEIQLVYPPWTLTAYAYYFSTLGMAILEIPNDLMNHQNTFGNFSTQIIVPLLYATCISSVMCFGFISYANSLTSATVVAAFYPLQTVATMLLSLVFLGEIPSTPDLMSSSLICGGVFIVCFSKYLEDREKQELKNEMTAVNEDLVTNDSSGLIQTND